MIRVGSVARTSTTASHVAALATLPVREVRLTDACDADNSEGFPVPDPGGLQSREVMITSTQIFVIATILDCLFLQ